METKHNSSNFFDEKLSKVIENQILRIANDSVEYIDEIGIGLCSGNSGLLLLYSHLNDIYTSKFSYLINKITTKIIYALKNGYKINSFSNGISGIGFMLHFIKTNFNIHVINEEQFFEIDQYLCRAINEDFKNGNWDPLHGYVGIGMYFIERSKCKRQNEILNKIVDQLYNDRKEVYNYKIWVTKGYKNYTNDNINFGLAHGIPGVLMFLTSMIKLEVNKNKCVEMINEIMKFFDPFYNNFNKQTISIFPSMLEIDKVQNNNYSRVAWCYGDLCLANVFYKVGTILNESEFLKKSEVIINHTINRPLETFKVNDAGFCHGTSGVIYQLYKFYRKNKNELIKDKIYELINLNQKRLKMEDGIGGFMFIEKSESSEVNFISLPDLLEGSTGVAMVYLSLLYDIKTDWDKIFFID